jgi:hypothetical protein
MLLTSPYDYATRPQAEGFLVSHARIALSVHAMSTRSTVMALVLFGLVDLWANLAL